MPAAYWQCVLPQSLLRDGGDFDAAIERIRVTLGFPHLSDRERALILALASAKRTFASGAQSLATRGAALRPSVRKNLELATDRAEREFMDRRAALQILLSRGLGLTAAQHEYLGELMRVEVRLPEKD
jgi:hypothetical protein